MLLKELRDARRSSGWSQRTLASRLGVDPQIAKRLEAGIGSVPMLVAAMDALDLRLTGIAPGITLPDQLRTRRDKLGWSLEKAAARAGLSRATVASIERGSGSIRTLVKLLNALAPNARRRAKERAYWGAGDKDDRDSRFTPPEFMEHIYAAFGPVDLDPCANASSPVVAQRRIILAEGGDGLIDDWSGRLAYVNPPYSEAMRWLRRAHDQWSCGHVETVLCLVPVRTDSTLFHETLSAVADFYLLRGRVRFLDPRGKAQHTPFSLMLLTLGTTAEQRALYAARVPGLWCRTASLNAHEADGAN